MSGVAVFILVTPANSTDAAANEERERGGERRTHRGREIERECARERQRQREGENNPPLHPEGIELSAKHLQGY